MKAEGWVWKDFCSISLCVEGIWPPGMEKEFGENIFHST